MLIVVLRHIFYINKFDTYLRTSGARSPHPVNKKFQLYNCRNEILVIGNRLKEWQWRISLKHAIALPQTLNTDPHYEQWQLRPATFRSNPLYNPRPLLQTSHMHLP